MIDGSFPAGNEATMRCTGVERYLWSGTTSPATMSSAERSEYEDKKLKMRKAMGENLGDDVPGETVDAKQRRYYP